MCLLWVQTLILLLLGTLQTVVALMASLCSPVCIPILYVLLGFSVSIWPLFFLWLKAHWIAGITKFIHKKHNLVPKVWIERLRGVVLVLTCAPKLCVCGWLCSPFLLGPCLFPVMVLSVCSGALMLLVLDPGAVLVISQVGLCVPKFLMLWLTF